MVSLEATAPILVPLIRCDTEKPTTPEGDAVLQGADPVHTLVVGILMYIVFHHKIVYDKNSIGESSNVG